MQGLVAKPIDADSVGEAAPTGQFIRVGITGASGFLATHLKRQLTSFNIPHFGWDIRPSLDTRWMDVRCNLEAGVFRECQVVIHMAALAGVSASIEHRSEYLATNTGGTANVLRAAVRDGVRRVIIVSSSSVYGECSEPAREGQPKKPLSPYGESKARAEDIANEFSLDLDICVARPFSVIGVDQRKDMLFSRLIRGEVKHIWDFRRDFTGVDYVARGLAALCKTTNPPGLDFLNLGAGKPISAHEVIDSIERITARVQKLSWVNRPPGEPVQTWSDNRKAEGIFGDLSIPSFFDVLVGQCVAAGSVARKPLHQSQSVRVPKGEGKSHEVDGRAPSKPDSHSRRFLSDFPSPH